MSDRLPDELISEILSPALQVPDDLFSDTSHVSPFAPSSAGSSASTLLVCKSWQRARALQATLKSSPDLGRYVKKLRVEGGFGNFMRDILQNTPNVNDIFLSLHIHSSDSSSGLALGLPLINPTRLILFDFFLRNNKAVEDLMTTLKTCVPKWNHLSTINFPYAYDMLYRESFCSAICSSPTITTLSFPIFHPNLVPCPVKFAQIPSLKAIEIRPGPTQTVTALPTSPDPRLNELLRWAETITKAPAIKRRAISRSRNLICPRGRVDDFGVWGRRMSTCHAKMSTRSAKMEHPHFS
ncbi:hypothetical protein DFH09DRAFT_1371178, partial [Mycena vulgaris]